MDVPPLEPGFPPSKPRATGVVAPVLAIAGVMAMVLAIAFALVLGTVGYFVVGFATMTSCTDAFSCTQTNCAPCQEAGNWLLTGAGIQGALALVGAGFLVLALWRARLREALVLVAIAIMVSSVLAIGSTKVAADHSFCGAGDMGSDGGCAHAG